MIFFEVSFASRFWMLKQLPNKINGTARLTRAAASHCCQLGLSFFEGTLFGFGFKEDHKDGHHLGGVSSKMTHPMSKGSQSILFWGSVPLTLGTLEDVFLWTQDTFDCCSLFQWTCGGNTANRHLHFSSPQFVPLFFFVFFWGFLGFPLNRQNMLFLLGS